MLEHLKTESSPIGGKKPFSIPYTKKITPRLSESPSC